MFLCLNNSYFLFLLRAKNRGDRRKLLSLSQTISCYRRLLSPSSRLFTGQSLNALTKFGPLLFPRQALPKQRILRSLQIGRTLGNFLPLQRLGQVEVEGRVLGIEDCQVSLVAFPILRCSASGRGKQFAFSQLFESFK